MATIKDRRLFIVTVPCGNCWRWRLIAEDYSELARGNAATKTEALAQARTRKKALINATMRKLHMSALIKCCAICSPNSDTPKW